MQCARFPCALAWTGKNPLDTSTNWTELRVLTQTKTPLRFLLTGAGIQMTSIAVSAVIGFLLTPLLIHTLGDRDYGLLDLIGSFAGWLGLMDFGLSGAVARYVAVHFSQGNPNESYAYATTGFYVYIGLGVVAFVTALTSTLALPWLISDPNDIPLIRTLIIIAGASFAIDLPLRALSGIINGFMRRDVTGWLSLISRIIRAFATVGILLLGGRLIALSRGSLILTIAIGYMWWHATRRIAPTFTLDTKLVSRKRIHTLMSFGGISFVGNLAESIVFRLDGFVIAYFVSIAAVPHYSIAIGLASYFQAVMVALTSWLINWFVHQGTKGKSAIDESLFFCTRACVIVGGFCLFGLIAFGSPFIERWMGTDYLDAYPCLVALSIGEFFRSFQRPNLNLLYAQAKQHIYALSTVAEAILNLILSIILVKKHGILGVAIGTMVASIIVNGVVFPTACCLAMRANFIRYWAAVLHGMATSAVLVVLPIILMNNFAAANYAVLVLMGVISGFLYIPPALVLGMTRNERMQIFAALRRKV